MQRSVGRVFAVEAGNVSEHRHRSLIKQCLLCSKCLIQEEELKLVHIKRKKKSI